MKNRPHLANGPRPIRPARAGKLIPERKKEKAQGGSRAGWVTAQGEERGGRPAEARRRAAAASGGGRRRKGEKKGSRGRRSERVGALGSSRARQPIPVVAQAGGALYQRRRGRRRRRLIGTRPAREGRGRFKGEKAWGRRGAHRRAFAAGAVGRGEEEGLGGELPPETGKKGGGMAMWARWGAGIRSASSPKSRARRGGARLARPSFGSSFHGNGGAATLLGSGGRDRLGSGG